MTKLLDTKQLKKIELNDGDYIPFVDYTKNLGNAEFIICPQWKNKKLVKLSIYPAQQENIDSYYEWEGKFGRKKLSFGSLHDLPSCRIWITMYCKEHKCMSLRLYVPRDSKFIYFNVLSEDISIEFIKHKF